MRAAFFLALVALAAQGADAATFLQCANGSATGLLALVGTVLNMILSTLFASTPASCAALCDATSFEYSVYMPGILNILLAQCYCLPASAALNAQYVTSGTNSAGSCSSSNFAIWELNPQGFAFTECTSGTTLTGGPTFTAVTDDSSCFTSCKDYPYMSMTPSVSGKSYTCTCGTKQVTGTAATCGNGVQTLYSNSAATLSIVARKRDRLRREEEARKPKSYCPRGMTACRIPDSSYDFECIDSNTELESCGGCTIGQFNEVVGNTTSTLGTDCTQLPGVALGAVQCISGGCKVNRCRAGWTLSNNACVPALTNNSEKTRRRR